MKFPFPSIDNENPLTWKCKLFGCKDESPSYLSFQIEGEKHGIKGFKRLTVTRTLINISHNGCSWCRNYKKIIGKEINSPFFEMWECDCKICNNN